MSIPRHQVVRRVAESQPCAKLETRKRHAHDPRPKIPPVAEYFGSNVFDDRAMKKYMLTEDYATLKEVTGGGKPMDLKTAASTAKGT